MLLQSLSLHVLNPWVLEFNALLCPENTFFDAIHHSGLKNLSTLTSMKILKFWVEGCNKYVPRGAEHATGRHLPYIGQLRVSVLIAIYGNEKLL